MRKIFQLDDQNEIVVLGQTEEHPHFYEGAIISINTELYRIDEIREDDLGKPLYVKPVKLNEVVVSLVSSELKCPYCNNALSESSLGATHDIIVDCSECSGVSHVQRFMDCQIDIEGIDLQEIDILYVILPKIAGKIIPINVRQ